ncbi:MAG: flagellar basal body L-ring protein FlgH [Planctomycetaceae bacterium]|jgi:flagellar L-ring protein precursor FlgH|nr:flagellar basal body L-ring protein FlgH [Planctomycetaceae bacterium]
MKEVFLSLVAVVSLSVPAARGQSASLFATPTTRMESQRPLLLQDTSFTASEIKPPKTFKVQDIIKVVVNNQFHNNNIVDTERKRKMNSSYGITSWIKLSGLGFEPAPMAGGNPEIAGAIDSQFKNKGKINQKELVEFKISCRIVSICNNGLLYVEGTNTQMVGQDESIFGFSGFVRPEDVRPDNTVLSEDVLDWETNVINSGAVHDSVKNGWGQRLIDKLSPF